MPQVTFTFSPKLTLVQKFFERLRGAAPKVAAERLEAFADDVVRRMQKPGRKAPKHINWDSIKQRTAFFASDAFGAGLPFVRTDRYINAWVKVKNSERSFTVQNTSPGALYIGGRMNGTGQSKIHQGRWPLFRDQMQYAFNALPKAVQRNLMGKIRELLSALRGH